MGEASKQGIGGEEWVEQTMISPLFLANLFRPYLPSVATLTPSGLSDPLILSLPLVSLSGPPCSLPDSVSPSLLPQAWGQSLENDFGGFHEKIVRGPICKGEVQLF